MTQKSLTEIEPTPYCYDSNQRDRLTEISERVQALRKTGRLTPEVLGRIRKYFRIKNIYHSNAIEGNALSLGETEVVVQQGLTISGKSLKDQAEAKNLNQAISFLEALAENSDQPIGESDLRQIHKLVLTGIDELNAGRYRDVQVEISGSDYKPPSPESVAPQMAEFGEWLTAASVPRAGVGSIEGLIFAAVAHTWLVYIHPFIDGNGRVARLLMNLILMRYGYPIAVITKEDRLRYYDSLEESQTSDLSSFIFLLSESIAESLEEYEHALDEQKEREEWAHQLADRFGARERTRYENEYEVWKSAMDLLRSYFRQTSELIDEGASAGKVFFKDFGTLEFEKYMSLRQGGSTKKTWFFRVDFRSGEQSARYLFFFGFPSHSVKQMFDVTLHVAREEPSGSFFYERLDVLNPDRTPSMVEIGYLPKEERFLIREQSNRTKMDRVEAIGKKFFDEVIRLHF